MPHLDNRILVLYLRTAMCAVFLANVALAADRPASTDDQTWRDRIGFNPLVHGGDKGGVIHTPDQVPGLILWLNAGQGIQTDASGRVMKWASREPAARMAIMDTPDIRPKGVIAGVINGHAAVQFAGTRDFGQGLTVNELPAAGPEGLTIIAVARADRDGFGMNALLHFGPDAPPQSLVMNFFTARVDEKDYGPGLASGAEVPGTGFRLMSIVADTRQGRLAVVNLTPLKGGAAVTVQLAVEELAATNRLTMKARRSGTGKENVATDDVVFLHGVATVTLEPDELLTLHQ